MSGPVMKHIVIIGGGFSGTMTAVNLARLSEVPLRVTVVNHGYPQGRGVAGKHYLVGHRAHDG